MLFVLGKVVISNVGQKMGYGDEILGGFVQNLHGNVWISVVDNASAAESTALRVHRV